MGKNICKICGEKEKIQINKNDFFLRTDSSNKKLIEYKNFVCVNCGTKIEVFCRKLETWPKTSVLGRSLVRNLSK